MLSIDWAPVSVSAADSATADMKSPPFAWLGETEPKVGAPHVFDNLFARGTNAEALFAAESKSADRTEIFLKSSIFLYPILIVLRK